MQPQQEPNMTSATPLISVVVIFHDMVREAERTLHSLSAAYQSVEFPYQVIAVDNGSSTPLNAARVRRFGRQFEHHFFATASPSPCAAVNWAVRRASANHVAVLVDGARILSPGILNLFAASVRGFDCPFTHTLGFHLGEELQNLSVAKGYSQVVEDRLLEQAGWQDDGYRLFNIACLAASSKAGYFGALQESNCFLIRRDLFLDLGGFNEAFQSPGGGLVNLDFFQRACRHPATTPIALLGEGTFHQFHGGVATNVRLSEHPWARFQEEYQAIHGHPWKKHESVDAIWLGRLHPLARRFALDGPLARFEAGHSAAEP